MFELDEAIDNAIDEKSNNDLNSKIAIIVAVTATFLALCSIKASNIVQNMSKDQSASVNMWAYFQAKSTKQNLTENAIELLKIQKGLAEKPVVKKNIDEQIRVYEEKVLRYEKEKEEIKMQAESHEKNYERLNVFDDQFDMTEAILSISIALFGLSALTKKRSLFYFAISLSLLGFILGLTAFINLPIQSEFVSSMLS